MYTPTVIANYFIDKSFETGVEITPMKLVKLVYISHGWYLAYNSKPLITEAVQAWKYGPVIESVYHLYKNFGSNPIIEKYHQSNRSAKEEISIEDKEFLDSIWNNYGKYSGLQLSTLTHQSNTPWDIVWNQKGGSKNKSAIIGTDLISEHYKLKLKQIAV